MDTDRPEPAVRPRRSVLDDLRERLSRLPAAHPSAPDYDPDPGGAAPAPGRREGQDAPAEPDTRAEPGGTAGGGPGVASGRTKRPAGEDLARLDHLERLARALWPGDHGGTGPAGARGDRSHAPDIGGWDRPRGPSGREPYRPWFCSGDPYRPWFTGDPGDRWC